MFHSSIVAMSNLSALVRINATNLNYFYFKCTVNHLKCIFTIYITKTQTDFLSLINFISNNKPHNSTLIFFDSQKNLIHEKSELN